MGTESYYPVGTKLTRKDKEDDGEDELVVVGGGDQLIVSSAVEFGPNFPLDVSVARDQYDADFPEGFEPGEPEVLRPGLTPEQVFAQTAREARQSGEPQAPRRGGRNAAKAKELEDEKAKELEDEKATSEDSS